MLFTTFGFSMNTHFCGGHAVKATLTIGEGEPDCGMKMMEFSCEDSPRDFAQIQSQPCCENHHQIIQLEGEVELTPALDFNASNFALVFVHSVVASILNPTVRVLDAPYSVHSPPRQERDIQVLFQTFIL